VARKNIAKLETYRAKRKAGRTREPFGGTLSGSRRFVVQQHAARARHYDFRLEWDGVLKSWAVPKGPSPNPHDKRLAVHVEDHPVEYASFEGLIPEGNYGAGAVIVWDRGRWLPLGDFDAGLSEGKLLFELKGYKLLGRWTLVKTRRGAKDWLLIKERDQYVAEEGTESYPPTSVLSGRTIEQLANGDDLAAPLRAQIEPLGARLRPVDAAKLRPMLAVAGEPFTRAGWIFEIKYDGYRLLCSKADGRITLFSRNGNDLTAVFPEVAETLAALPFASFVIDGETIVHDEQGLPSFSRLQKRGRLTRRADIERAAVDLPATLYAFDLLSFEGYDLRSLALLDRKAVLRELLPRVGPLRYSEHIERQGERMFEQVGRMGLEGIVAKRGDSTYVCRRSTQWVKINTEKVDDFVVVGYTPPQGSQPHFGALLLGQHVAGELRYAGRVGTGFNDRERRDIGRRLKASNRAQAPGNAPPGDDAIWLEGSLVVSVKFKERTDEGALRQPAFLRAREDKAPAECVWPGALADAPAAAPTPAMEAPRLTLTNLDKVLWPAEGYAKGDLIDYYRAVARWALPYLRDRPVVLTRYPDGIEGKSFFQKDAPAYAPDWVRLERMWSEESGREIRYFVIESADGLAYVANMASIPLHVWSSRAGSLESPDWSILDLDPKGAPFGHVVKIALHLHELCMEIGLPNFVKTSGSTGLHVLVPLGAAYTFEQSRILAELLARVTVQALGDIATITRSVGRRQGKVYIDYLQNGHGKLLVAPLSVRPLPGAPVSMPLTWEEVNARLKLERFTIRTAPRLLAKRGDPMADVLRGPVDLAGALARLAARAS
jgi:bifunctional non-homologous end joining protein LigD